MDASHALFMNYLIVAKKVCFRRFYTRVNSCCIFLKIINYLILFNGYPANQFRLNFLMIATFFMSILRLTVVHGVHYLN